MKLIWLLKSDSNTNISAKANVMWTDAPPEFSFGDRYIVSQHSRSASASFLCFISVPRNVSFFSPVFAEGMTFRKVVHLLQTSVSKSLILTIGTFYQRRWRKFIQLRRSLKNFFLRRTETPGVFDMFKESCPLRNILIIDSYFVYIFVKNPNGYVISQSTTNGEMKTILSQKQFE